MGGAVNKVANVGSLGLLGDDFTGSKAAATAMSDANARASRSETEMFDKNMAFQREQWESQQGRMDPYLQAGNQALGQYEQGIAGGYGGYNPRLGDYGDPNIGFAPPSAQSFGLDPNIGYERNQLTSPEATRWGGDPNLDVDVMKDPSFEFRRQQGQRGVGASASAGGMTLSGSALKDLTRFNQDYASTEYGKAYGRSAQDFARQQGQDRDFFGAQRQVGLDQFGAAQGQADRQLAASTADYGRAYGAESDLYSRQNAQAMDQYNVGSQNFARQAGLMDQQYSRDYGMYNDQLNRQQGLANMGYGAAGGLNQGSGQFSSQVGGLMQGQGQNLSNMYMNQGQIQSQAATSDWNQMMGVANMGLSAYGMFGGGGAGATGGAGAATGGMPTFQSNTPNISFLG